MNNKNVLIKKIRTINDVKDNITFMCLLKDGRIAAALVNYTVAIFNKNIFTVIDYLAGHKDLVSSICQTNNFNLITSSADNDIKIWKPKGSSYQCEFTIKKAHEHLIEKVITLRHNRFASCSCDLTIKIWSSSRPYNLIKVLEGHKGYVTCIIELRKKDILISGSVDGELRFWNTNNTLQCESIFKEINCYNNKNIIEVENDRVVIAEMTSLIVINLKKMNVEEYVDLNIAESVICITKMKERFILCGCKGGTLLIINEDLKVVLKKKIHEKAITSLLVYFL